MGGHRTASEVDLFSQVTTTLEEWAACAAANDQPIEAIDILWELIEAAKGVFVTGSRMAESPPLREEVPRDLGRLGSAQAEKIKGGGASRPPSFCLPLRRAFLGRISGGHVGWQRGPGSRSSPFPGPASLGAAFRTRAAACAKRPQRPWR